MFIGLKELRSAPGRTSIIILTVSMIAMLVTFLSSLAAGLSYESVSALQARSQASPVSANPAIVMPDTGSTSLLSAQLSQEQIEELSSASDGHIDLLYTTRGRTSDGEPILYMSEPLSTSQSQSSNAIADSSTDEAPINSWQPGEDLKFDHLSVEFKPSSEIKEFPQVSSVALIPSDKVEAVESLSSSEHSSGTNYLLFQGKDRWKISASYSGEQISLNLMVVMLYIISALVIGAFFMVWTMQRLRTVSISFALGASHRFIITDALGQAAAILCVGIFAGLTISWSLGTLIKDTLPIQLTASTLLVPALILGVAGMIGAVISTMPILKVSPHDALANA